MQGCPGADPGFLTAGGHTSQATKPYAKLLQIVLCLPQKVAN